MKRHQKPSIFALLAFLIIGGIVCLQLSACDEKGPLKKAGEKIDKTIDDIGDNVEDVGKEVEDGLEPD